MTASLSVGELLNIVGLTMGVALYAMLLVMVVRGGKTPAASGRLDPLLLVTALLGLVWNASALPAYDLVKVGIEGPFRLLSAIGFSALGFLPAVVVHSVLRGERQHVSGMARRAIGIAAYVVSGAAMFLQFRAAWAGAPVPAPPAMRLLTYSFVALIVPLAIVTRDQPGSRRALWGAALATFAVSALHLSQFHRGDVAWPVELMGHHASVPLALAILYQDYPFALADLFLKRLLSLLAIVAVVFAAIATFGAGPACLGRRPTERHPGRASRRVVGGDRVDLPVAARRLGVVCRHDRVAAPRLPLVACDHCAQAPDPSGRRRAVE